VLARTRRPLSPGATSPCPRRVLARIFFCLLTDPIGKVRFYLRRGSNVRIRGICMTVHQQRRRNLTPEPRGGVARVGPEPLRVYGWCDFADNAIMQTQLIQRRRDTRTVGLIPWS
jgi:hypothetical protein